MTDIVILGASGRLGRMITAGCDRRPPPRVRLRTPKWHWTPNLPVSSKLTDLLEGADCVISLAGITPTNGRNWTDADFETFNVELAQHVLEHAQDARVPRVLLASSAAVYGTAGKSGKPLSEDLALPTPSSPYARSKLRMEALAGLISDAGGLEVCCLRIANVAGADQLVLNALKAQRSAEKTAVTLDIFPDGCGPQRSYIGPYDFADTLIALAEHQGPLPRILNVAAPDPAYMDRLLEALNKALGWLPTVVARPAPEGAIARVVLDTCRLQALSPLPHRAPPEPDLAAQVQRYLQSLTEAGDLWA